MNWCCQVIRGNHIEYVKSRSFRLRERESKFIFSVYAKHWYWSHSLCYVQEAGRWWRHDMEAYSALQALCEGNPPVIDGFPSKSARNAELRCFIWCTPNKKLSKLWSFRWFGMPLHSYDAVIPTFVTDKISSSLLIIICFTTESVMWCTVQ